MTVQLRKNSLTNQGQRMAHRLTHCNQFSRHSRRNAVSRPPTLWYVYPRSLQSFTKESTAGVSSRNITLTNKSNSLTYIVASSLVCTSPLAVITVVGLLDVLMVSNSAELRSFLLTICKLAPESITNSLSSSSFVDAAGNTPIPPREN